MKLLMFSPKGLESPRLGVLVGGGILDVARGFRDLYDAQPPSWFHDLKLLIEGGSLALDLLRMFVNEAERDLRSSSPQLSRHVYSLDGADYYPPITSPGKILCLAANYMAHARESGVKPPEEPYIFYKPSTALTGHERPVIIPRSSSMADYEAELAVVVGKRGKYVSPSKALDHVFGYTVFNDVSFRDHQRPPGWPDKPSPFGMRWLHGKGMDTAAPTGPWVVTRDEIPDPHQLRIGLRVNGETRQDSSTGDMIFKIPTIIEYITQGITLAPGDIIATGTPPGVGMASGKYLKPGDVMEAFVEGIGVLRNPVVAERGWE